MPLYDRLFVPCQAHRTERCHDGLAAMVHGLANYSSTTLLAGLILVPLLYTWFGTRRSSMCLSLKPSGLMCAQPSPRPLSATSEQCEGGTFSCAEVDILPGSKCSAPSWHDLRDIIRRFLFATDLMPLALASTYHRTAHSIDGKLKASHVLIEAFDIGSESVLDQVAWRTVETLWIRNVQYDLVPCLARLLGELPESTLELEIAPPLPEHPVGSITADVAAALAASLHDIRPLLRTLVLPGLSQRLLYLEHDELKRTGSVHCERMVHVLEELAACGVNVIGVRRRRGKIRLRTLAGSGGS